MPRVILPVMLVVLFVSTAVFGDSCSNCHGNRARLATMGAVGFTVTTSAVVAQTHMPAACSDCHLGDPEQTEKELAHRGMARLLVVTKKGMTTMTGVRRLPLAYGTSPASRIYTLREENGRTSRDPSVAAISWQDKNPLTLTQDFSVMANTCGTCHTREVAEFGRSTMGSNGKQSQYRGWQSAERGPHNCGPWFADSIEALRAEGRVPLSLESTRIGQKVCNTCHVGCLDCHFLPQQANPADPTRGPHTFVKTPPPESCYGNGRNSICHSGPEERRRGAGYFGGPFSFPEGNSPDVHLRAGVGCLDCHDSSARTPSLGHGMVQRQARGACRRCHLRATESHAVSRHRNLACEACHIQMVSGYQGTYWGPGILAGVATPYFKFKAYYGVMAEPILIRDQAGLWIPVKPFPMAVMNQKSAPFTQGLHWRYPESLPPLQRTDDAWGYVGIFGGLPENNDALLWIQMDKVSHKLGTSRSCDSCHGRADGSQLQRVSWEYSDPGAFPFSGSHEVHATSTGLFISAMQSEKIEVEPGYHLSAFAPWVYLRDKWRLTGDFALPLIGDKKAYESLRDDPEAARRAGIVHR